MFEHSKALETTILWKTYEKKTLPNTQRIIWIKEVYKTAVMYLKDVRQVFKNYTLHDETHILNVLDAMGGLLGDYIDKLTVGEIELLILAASLHDLGMVYTNEEKEIWFENKIKYKEFLRENRPDLLGYTPKEWSEDIQQWYLRIQHPFRIWEVLENAAWKDLFDTIPVEIVSKEYVLAVCEAHGENPERIRSNNKLDYLPASETDPRFCALLLRLADLLDFDDTRAPKVLYSYVEYNEKSCEEWKKHQASAGFTYPSSPSMNELPYKARCKSPGIEHAVREFLNWVDYELDNCIKLKSFCSLRWKEFPFPRAVSRVEIISDGYMSGDFCMTMNQEQILNLLMGENLYDDRDVFVRELLQNAIDATLLHGEMNPDFIPEQSRIDFWEWNDREGNFWFRIDDQGTGMTLGMLQRYFLKVGNSYYTSKELERDLHDHNQTKSYQGISRFGIGFLSCFLCGDYIEVSTLYFDPEKNRREESTTDLSRTANYGLRLEITGLTGYYTLKNQAKNHQINSPLPIPDFCKTQSKLERGGYRVKPGTSIVIRLNPGKMGTLNLYETVKTYLCAARVPVYYNNKRVGRTYKETMQIVHEQAGERVYELPPKLKKEFDTCFPALCGQYPKLAVTVIPLDTKEDQIFPELSGVIIKYHVRFEKKEWRVKDQKYQIDSEFRCSNITPEIKFYAKNINKNQYRTLNWSELEEKYGMIETTNLAIKLESFLSCPETEEQLGEVWIPFSGGITLKEVWIAYYNYQNEKTMSFDRGKYNSPNLYTIFRNNQTTIYVYKGVRVSKISDFINTINNAVFLLDGEFKPTIKISRSQVSKLPLKLSMAIAAILNKYQLINYYVYFCRNIPLQEWREIRIDPLNKWMNRNYRDYFKEKKEKLQKQQKKKEGSDFQLLADLFSSIMDKYLMAYLQDNYSMTINYEEGQIITFHKKKKEEHKSIYDIFPPMMFCNAASDQSRKYICHTNKTFRRGITEDHPFIIWLFENSVQLNQYFQRQFEQIIDSLCQLDAKAIIQNCNMVREQLLSLSNHYGVDVNSFPQLSIDDFWSEEE